MTEPTLLRQATPPARRPPWQPTPPRRRPRAPVGAGIRAQGARPGVHAQGLDPSGKPAIAAPDLAGPLRRLAAASVIRADDVDQDMREGLRARRHCSAYPIAVEGLQRRRSGSCWLDSLKSRRKSVTADGRADMLPVCAGKALAYPRIGGRPTIPALDLRRNPPGPLQGSGDQSILLMR